MDFKMQIESRKQVDTKEDPKDKYRLYAELTAKDIRSKLLSEAKKLSAGESRTYRGCIAPDNKGLYHQTESDASTFWQQRLLTTFTKDQYFNYYLFVLRSDLEKDNIVLGDPFFQWGAIAWGDDSFQGSYNYHKEHHFSTVIVDDDGPRQKFHLPLSCYWSQNSKSFLIHNGTERIRRTKLIKGQTPYIQLIIPFSYRL